MTFELTKDYLAHLQSAIDVGDDALLRTEMEELFPADISGILYELDPEPARYLLGLLDKSVGTASAQSLYVARTRAVH